MSKLCRPAMSDYVRIAAREIADSLGRIRSRKPMILRSIRRFLQTITIVAFMGSSGCVSHPEQIVEVTVTLSRSGTDLSVRYDASTPLASLSLDPDNPISSSANILVEHAAGVVESGNISLAHASRTVTLRISPDSGGVSGTYPTLVPLGPNGVLAYLPALLPDPVRYRSRVRYALGSGDVRHSGGSDAEEALSGFVFIGSRSCISDQASPTVLACSDATRDSVREIRTRAERIVAFYSERLARGPYSVPIIAVPEHRPGEMFAGEATPNGFIVLPVASLPQTTKLLAHELFHLWNGRGFHARADANDLWLLEGGAEYGGMLAIDTLWPGEIDFKRQLTDGIGPCIGTVGDAPLTQLTGQRAQTTSYSCGLIAHWALDVGVRHASRGRESIFSVWRDLFGGRAVTGTYDGASLDGALRRYGDPSASAFSLLAEGRGTNRWQDFFAALRGMGVDAGDAPPPDWAFREAVLWTVLRAACGPHGYGFEERGQRLYFDVGEACNVIAPSAELLTIFDMPAFGRWEDIHRLLLDACSRHGEVPLRLRADGQQGDRRVLCAVEPSPIPRTFEVRTAFATQ